MSAVGSLDRLFRAGPGSLGVTVLGTASSTWLSMSFRTAEEALSEGDGGCETAEDPGLLLMIDELLADAFSGSDELKERRLTYSSKLINFSV